MTREEIETTANQKLSDEFNKQRIDFTADYLKRIRSVEADLVRLQKEYERVVNMSDADFAEYLVTSGY